MSLSVRGVIFDMGGTLLHYHPPGGEWEDMEKAGAQAMIRMLTQLGHDGLPPLPEAVQHCWEAMQVAWKGLRDNTDMATMTLGYQLRQVTNGWGLMLSDEEILIAEHAYTAGSQVYVRPFPDALHTLQTLKERGYPVGLISNTVWPGTAHQYDLMHYGLWPYLDFALFSSDVRAWKPFPNIFIQAVQRMHLAPDEVVYVGDNLFFDVYGAQQAGLKAVWIEQSQRWWPPTLEVNDIIPEFTIQQLSDLLLHLNGGA